jgi:hypothetical protein
VSADVDLDSTWGGTAASWSPDRRFLGFATRGKLDLVNADGCQPDVGRL